MNLFPEFYKNRRISVGKIFTYNLTHKFLKLIWKLLSKH